MLLISSTLKLNDIINGHILEDLEVWASYSYYQAEPDVGQMTPWVEIDSLYSEVSGRKLNRIHRGLSEKAILDLERQILENG